MAEKSIVCLVDAVSLIISFICSAKTSSSILSASSRIRTSTEWRLKEGALCRWSMRRPGVAEKNDQGEEEEKGEMIMTIRVGGRGVRTLTDSMQWDHE